MIDGIENAYPNYGLPKKKKYPLPDRKHVLSAIRFFNYVSPQDEKQLAEAILEKIKEYGMKDVGVGPDNRFLKYYKKDADHLEHHGILGGGERVLRKQNKREVELDMSDFKITRNDELMHYRTKGSKNGVRLYQNPDGSLTPLGERHYRDMYGYSKRRSGYGQDAGSSGRSVAVTSDKNKNVTGASSYGKVFQDTSMGPSVLKRNPKYKKGDPRYSPVYDQDPDEVREIGYHYGRTLFPGDHYDSAKSDLYEDPRNFQKTPGDKTAPLHKSREDMKEKLLSKYGSERNIPRDQYEAYLNTPDKDSTEFNNRKNQMRIDKAMVDERRREQAEKEKAESLSGRLQSAYDGASKWVVERADDAKKAAEDAYGKASEAVGKAKDAADKAYDDASKWVVDRADDAKKAAEDAYGKASEAVVDAADKAKGALDQAYQDAAKWLTTAADDVKKTAGEAFDAGKEWVEQAGKDVGEFVDSAVSDVMKAVDDAKNGVTDAANTVGKAAQDGLNWLMGLFGGGNKKEKSKSGPSNRRDEAMKK